MVHRRWIGILLVSLLSIGAGHFSLAAAPAAATASLSWQPTLEEAKRVASESNRLILVHFWAPSCKDCKRLEHDVFSQPQVQQAVNARFVAFKLNADDFPTTTRQYGVDRLPTDLIITPAGQIVGRMKCPLTADAYIQQLNIVASSSVPPVTGAAPGASAMNMPAAQGLGATGYPAAQLGAAAPGAPAQSAYAYPPNMSAAMNNPNLGAPAAGATATTMPAMQPSASMPGTAAAPYAASPYMAAASTPQYTPPQVAAAATPPAAKPAMPSYSDDRYAEYYQRFSSTPGAPGAAATSAVTPGVSSPSLSLPQSTMPSAQPGIAAAPYTSPAAMGPRYSSPAASTVQYGNPPAAQSSITNTTLPQFSPGVAAVNWPANSTAAASPTASAPAGATASASPTAPYTGPSIVGVPSGNIIGVTPGMAAATTTPAAGAVPLGMEGYCPVTLAEQKRWQVGDRRYGVIHRGRTYLFAGPAEQQKFLSNPDHYSPAGSGQDVVAALDQNQSIDGRRQFGLEYQNRVYLFSSDASRRAFSQNPNRYAAEVLQAENPNRLPLR